MVAVNAEIVEIVPWVLAVAILVANCCIRMSQESVQKY